MKIDIPKGGEVETDEYSIDTLSQLAVEILAELQTVRGLLRKAHAQAHRGNYSDPDWYNDTTVRKERLANAHQELLRALGQRRRAKRQQESVQLGLPKHFVSAAKAILSADTFETVMREAMRRYGDTQEGVQVSARYLFEE